MSTGPNTSTAREFSFGSFRVLAAERRLLNAGEPVEIGSRALDILIALVERAGEVVGKKALIARVWPDVIVEESNLRVHVAALRKVLGDGVDGARYVANVPGRGYSFVATVAVVATDATSEQTSAVATGTSTLDSAQTRVAHNLPARLTRMVGRDTAVTAVSEQLLTHRFVTIVGPGGLGKTTVAVPVAHVLSTAFANTIFVDLTAVTDAPGVANGLASTLGLTVRKEDPTPEILAFLRDQRVLLVLDNCEHVVEAIGRLAERIFAEAARVHILATSRERLNVEGEHLYVLEPLTTPGDADITAQQALEYASVQLFLERVNAAGSALSLTDADAPVVARICQHLDGVALAVELAAGRVSAFGLRGTAELLDKQLGLAWRGRRTALPRHQTLSATLDWSYSLLSREEQLVLQRLSVFVGDFVLGGALAIAGDHDGASSEIIETIADLVSKSLVSMRIIEGQPRYRLLEMVRAYAGVRLADSSDAAAIAARHARYFAQRCREAEAPDSAAVDSLDLGNIRAALEWSFSEHGDAALARDLAIAVTPILLRWSLLAECRRWSARALEALHEADRDSLFESQLIRTLAISTMFSIGNDERVRVQMMRGLDLARSFGDRRGQFDFFTGLHAFAARTGDFRGAVSAATDAAEIAGDAEYASARWMLCMGHHLLGEQVQALASSEQALAREAASALKRKRYFGYDQRTSGLAVRARLLWLTGQTEEALQAARQAADEGAANKHPVSYCLTLLYATSVYLWSGRLADAEQSIERLVDTSKHYLLEPYFAGGQMLRGELLHAGGEHESAIPLLRDAAQRLTRERQIAQAPYCASILADALRATSQFRPALDVLDQAIEQRQLGGGSYDLPEMLRIRAHVLLGISDDNRGAAVESLRQALDLARNQGAASWALRAGLALTQLQPGEGRDLIETLVARFPHVASSPDLAAARSMFAS